MCLTAPRRGEQAVRRSLSGGIATVARMSGLLPVLRLGTRKGFRRAPAPMTARAWYERGVELERIDVAAAREAYAKAIGARPDDAVLADASCNLGRLLHEAGDVEGAEGCYRLALCADREIAVYWFNLGVAVEDRGRRAEAIACYCEALARDSHLAEAHFNLARLYERAGDLDSARARG